MEQSASDARSRRFCSAGAVPLALGCPHPQRRAASPHITLGLVVQALNSRRDGRALVTPQVRSTAERVVSLVGVGNCARPSLTTAFAHDTGVSPGHLASTMSSGSLSQALRRILEKSALVAIRGLERRPPKTLVEKLVLQNLACVLRNTYVEQPVSMPTEGLQALIRKSDPCIVLIRGSNQSVVDHGRGTFCPGGAPA
jgi:hypothetical protein